MNYRKLDKVINWLVAAAAAFIIIPACNNSNKSENNSTTADPGANKTEPSVTTTDTSRTAKRVGRIAVAQMLRNTKNEKVAADNTGTYNYAEVDPIYPGGQTGLEDYIKEHLVYPDDALQNNIEGTVNVRFTIDANGNVGDVRTEGNALGYGLEDAAVKAVREMAKWTPGKIHNKAVKAWYTLPVTFRLES